MLQVTTPVTNNPHDVPRLIREVRRPRDVKGRLRLAVDKLRGDGPFDVDAPSQSARQVIGGAAVLLLVLRYSFMGFTAVVFGSLFIWAGCYGQLELKVVAIGVALLAIGAFFLVRAGRHWTKLKAIAEA